MRQEDGEGKKIQIYVSCCQDENVIQVTTSPVNCRAQARHSALNNDREASFHCLLNFFLLDAYWYFF